MLLDHIFCSAFLIYLAQDTDGNTMKHIVNKTSRIGDCFTKKGIFLEKGALVLSSLCNPLPS